MKNKRSLFSFIVVLCLVLALNLYGRQNYRFEAPRFNIDMSAGDFQHIEIDNGFSYGIPGFPDLPTRTFRVAVPPDADPNTITVNYTVTNIEDLGLYDIREIPALAAYVDDRAISGYKADIYTKDRFFPEESVEYAGFSRMRKWRIVTVKYTPFQYNPVSKELRAVSVDVTVDYETFASADSAGGSISTERFDSVMDHRAESMLLNFNESAGWYEKSPAASYDGLSSASAAYDYVIITTNAIESASTKLGAFVSYLGGKGFSPLVVTEDDYGVLTGQAPNGTADKIRKWLQNNYVNYGIKYVLLIGNPDPDDPSNPSDSVGDVPMKMCWPRRNETTYKDSPTDYFYADLTGNWDLDGDLYYGEYGDDTGAGGVDFANEVYVGRIPVYSGTANLDSILTKTINYGTSSDTSWRNNALLSMSYSDASTDGAYLGEGMKNDYLTTAGFSTWTQYQQGGLCAVADSSFTSDEDLVDGEALNRWAANPYGMVWWWGHGSTTGAYVGYSGCGWGGILYASQTPTLDDTHPSFVYQNSCTNGYPESSGNLGASLLRNGAIATVSAGRVSWYAVASWGTWLKYFADNASIGYYYGYELSANEKDAGTALFDVKSDMGANLYTYWDGCHMMNLFDFNLYGDPSISLSSRGSAAPASLTPTSPGTGSLIIGSTLDVTWTSTGLSGKFINVILLKDGAAVGTIAKNVSVDSGSFSWTVGQHLGGTAAAGTGYEIKIKEKSIPLVVKSPAFTLSDAPGITVTSPGAQEVSWAAGSTQNITWTSTGLSGKLVNVILLKNGATVGTIAKNVSVDSGAYSWTVGSHLAGTAAAGTGYEIKLKEKSTPVVVKSAAFTIASPPTLTLSSPNGGESLVRGSTRNITWNSSQLSGKYVNIILYKNGVTVGTIAKNVSAATGAYSWSVGQHLAGTAAVGTGYTVKVKEKSLPLVDVSDSSFSLTD